MIPFLGVHPHIGSALLLPHSYPFIFLSPFLPFLPPHFLPPSLPSSFHPPLPPSLPLSLPPSLPSPFSHFLPSSPPPHLPVCHFIAHEKCIPHLRMSCRHIIAEKIMVCSKLQNPSTSIMTVCLFLFVFLFSCLFVCLFVQDPVAHQWTQPMSFHRKKWCNVCRKKILGKGVICEGMAVISLENVQ